MSTPGQPRVVVIGGGWAGLAAAIELARHDIPVTVLESSRQLGGRARRVAFGRDGVDNGQHLLIAAYHETLRLMEVLGLPERQTFLRQPLRLDLWGNGRKVSLRAPTLPAPLHLGWALLTARGLGLGERLRALAFSLHLWVSNFTCARECSVSELLARHRQPAALVEGLWGPLCLAALNMPPERASAQVFLRVLRDTFARRRADSDLLLTRVDLGHAFPEPALDFIERHGGTVRLNSRATDLEVEGGRIRGVFVDNERLPAEHVIVAAPPHVAQRLLAPHPLLRPIADRLPALGQEPIVTVYLRYPPAVQLGVPMLGLVGGLAQWVFDRRIYGQPGLMAVVISGPGEHMLLEREQLAAQVTEELAAHFPDWPAPAESLVIREKRATFSCGVNVDAARPDYATAVQGCWLAGDYTATGYPATLEGAVRSGVQCALRILAERDRQFL